MHTAAEALLSIVEATQQCTLDRMLEPQSCSKFITSMLIFGAAINLLLIGLLLPGQHGTCMPCKHVVDNTVGGQL